MTNTEEFLHVFNNTLKNTQIKFCKDSDDRFVLSKYVYGNYKEISKDYFFSELKKSLNGKNEDFYFRTSDSFRSLSNASLKYYLTLDKKDQDLFFNGFLKFLEPKILFNSIQLLYSNKYSVIQNHPNHSIVIDFLNQNYFKNINPEKFLDILSLPFKHNILYDDFKTTLVKFFDNHYFEIEKEIINSNQNLENFQCHIYSKLKTNININDIHLFDKYLHTITIKEQNTTNNQLVSLNTNNLAVTLDLSLLKDSFPSLSNKVNVSKFLNHFLELINTSEDLKVNSINSFNDNHETFIISFKNDKKITLQQFGELLSIAASSEQELSSGNLNSEIVMIQSIKDYLKNAFLFNSIENTIKNKTKSTSNKI